MCGAKNKVATSEYRISDEMAEKDSAEDSWTCGLKGAFFLEYIVDFLLDFGFVKNLFEVVGDLFTVFENFRAFFKKQNFEFAAFVFFFADFENKYRVTHRNAEQKDQDLHYPKNQVLFKHVFSPSLL